MQVPPAKVSTPRWKRPEPHPAAGPHSNRQSAGLLKRRGGGPEATSPARCNGPTGMQQRLETPIQRDPFELYRSLADGESSPLHGLFNFPAALDI